MKTPLSKFEALLDSVIPRLDQDTHRRAALSFFNAHVRERRRRLAWVMRLMDEYRRVEAINITGTRLMLADIESVIEGDFLTLQADLRFWSYDDDPGMKEALGALHAPWSALISEYIAETEAKLGGLGEA